MQLTLNDLLNKEKNKTALICGLGSSLNQYKPILSENADKTRICISCNEWDIKAPYLRVNYWVLSSTVNTIDQRHERFNNSGATIVYEEGLDYTPREKVKQLLKVNYCPYDQRHYEGQCKTGQRPGGRNWCCDFNIPERLTIMQYLQKITGYEQFYKKTDSVALNMTTFAILLGFNPISILGVDLDYKIPYAAGSYSACMIKYNDNILLNYRKDIIESFEIINESAKKIDTTIYCGNRDSVLCKVFKYKKLT